MLAALAPLAGAQQAELPWRVSAEPTAYLELAGELKETVATDDRWSATETARRALAFRGLDLQRKPKDSPLRVLGPLRLAVLALLRMPAQSYVLGNSYNQGVRWGKGRSVRYSVRLTRPTGDPADPVAIEARARVSHPDLLGTATIELRGRWEPITRRVERLHVDYQATRRVLPLWWTQRPPRPAKRFHHRLLGVLRWRDVPADEPVPAGYTADAVEAAVNVLLSRQRKDGSWDDSRGTTAGVVVALTSSGIPLDHPALGRAVDYMLSNYERRDPLEKDNPQVLSSSTMLVAARALQPYVKRYRGTRGEGRLKAWVDFHAKVLEKAFARKTGYGGVWKTYLAAYGLIEVAEAGLRPLDRELALGITEVLLGWQQSEGPKVKLTPQPAPKPKPKPRPTGSGSVETVFRLPPDPPPIDPIAARGWGYLLGRPGGEAYGATTLASIAVLGRLRRYFKDDSRYTGSAEGRKLAAAIDGGWAWLQHGYQERYTAHDPTPVHQPTLLHYLRALDLAGETLERSHVGGRRWYDDGVHELLRIQRPEGFWEEKSDRTLMDLWCSLGLQFLQQGRARAREAGAGKE